MYENMMQVQVVTTVALVLFFAVMIYLGIYSTGRTKTMEGFLLGGRNIGAWMSAFAYGTTYFSAVIFIGYAGKHGWDIGIAGVWIGIANALLGCLLAWKVLAKRTRNMTHNLNVKTMPEFFEARYSETNMKLFAAVIIFIFLVPYSSAVYKGLGSLFNTIFPNVPVNICMLMIAVITAIFLVLGGYLASVYTSFVQGIIMFFGVIIMTIIIVFNPVAGGPVNVARQLREIDPKLVNIFGGSSFGFLMTNILLTSFGTWGLPQMINKFYAIKDNDAIKKGTIVSTVFALLIGAGAYYVGSMGRIFLDNQLPAGGYDYVVPQILLRALGDPSLFTTIILAVILLLLLSASMSTLSAVVLTSASAISVDLLPSVLPNIRDNKKQMNIMRGLCLLFVLLSYIFASFQLAIIVTIMSFSWGMVSGCFIGPYVWGLYSRKTTKAGAWAGMLGGFLTITLLTLIQTMTQGFTATSANAPLYGVLAMAVSFIMVPVVSRFTPKLPGKLLDKAFKENKSFN